MKCRAFALSMLAGIALVPTMGCASASSSSSSPEGCDVSFADVQSGSVTLLTTPFHDRSSIALFWNPKMKHLDVLGGDVSDRPVRSFELELYGAPIVDGASVPLRLTDPADPLTPTPSLSFVEVDAQKMKASGGTVRFTTASDTRLVFTVDGATMVTLDPDEKAVPGAPSLTMSLRCDLAASVDP